jgi:hypothetical protein
MCNAGAMSGAGFSVRGFPRKILKVVITALTSEGLFIFFGENLGLLICIRIVLI